MLSEVPSFWGIGDACDACDACASSRYQAHLRKRPGIEARCEPLHCDPSVLCNDPCTDSTVH